MITFSILTLGCKVNSYESEAVINDLINHGWLLKKSNEVCDVYIVNTCTVTATSDQKSRQMLHAAKRQNPSSIVVAMGCFSQLNPQTALEIADIVIGNNNKLQVYELINSYLQTKKSIEMVSNLLEQPVYEEMKVSKLKTHTRGFIKIQDGCENYCSYCAIPYARGKIRSRNADSIIEEINNLVNEGTKEVILAGINTGTYGFDTKTITLAGLIERIMKETNLPRLRLSSIELKEITDELLDVLKKYEDRVAKHLHIPLQAGSDGVLRRMNRKYTTFEYELRIADIRKLFPNIALTTDVLAGFVGETEEEFEEAVRFIKRINFFEMHVFPYSKRKGTKAYDMEGHLKSDVIKSRAHILQQIAKDLKDNYINSYLGQILDVLVETKKNDYYHGHSSNYLDIYFKSNDDLTNKFVKLKITKYENGIIYGIKEGEKHE